MCRHCIGPAQHGPPSLRIPELTKGPMTASVSVTVNGNFGAARQEYPNSGSPEVGVREKNSESLSLATRGILKRLLVANRASMAQSLKAPNMEVTEVPSDVTILCISVVTYQIRNI